MSHSPEPWSIPIDEEGWLCINCAGGTVLGLPHWVQQEMSATMLSAEDAHRIVACVNACRGIPTERLFPGMCEIALHVSDAVADSVTRKSHNR